MKKYIYLFSIFVTQIIYSQIPIRSIGSSNLDDDEVNGAYHKDTNDMLLNFIGTWEATWESKTITLILEKVTQGLTTNSDNTYYYEDYLIGKFQVKNANGDVIIPYFVTNDVELAKLTSITYINNFKIGVFYNDVENCNNSELVILELNASNLNSMNYRFQRYQDFMIMPLDCPYASEDDIPISIPTVPVTFTKL